MTIVTIFGIIVYFDSLKVLGAVQSNLSNFPSAGFNRATRLIV